MKKLILALVALFTMTVSANAMSYEQARQQALFLTDKMAYELNLTDEQYEAAYEINLDYLMGVNSYDDLYGLYWRQRNLDLSYILLDWQYRSYLDALYFYRPLYWDGGYWHFRIYARYPHRDYYFFGCPNFYAVYRGGHSWRMNGGHSWYSGREFAGPRRDGAPGRMGMRDGFNRGDYGNGDRSFGNGTRFSNQNSSGRTFGNGSRFGNNNGTTSNNRSFGGNGSTRSFGGSSTNRSNGSSTSNRTFGGSGISTTRPMNGTISTSRPGVMDRSVSRESSTRATVARPNSGSHFSEGELSSRKSDVTSSGSRFYGNGTSVSPSNERTFNRPSISTNSAPARTFGGNSSSFSRSSAPSRSYSPSSAPSRSYSPSSAPSRSFGSSSFGGGSSRGGGSSFGGGSSSRGGSSSGGGHFGGRR